MYSNCAQDNRNLPVLYSISLKFKWENIFSAKLLKNFWVYLNVVRAAYVFIPSFQP